MFSCTFYHECILYVSQHLTGLILMFEIFSVLPYFFAYQIESFSFQNNPKNLDPSYKMDLDL